MLQLLHIENIAVIEEADITFDEGFNALTGETGAGKSIVIDAMGGIQYLPVDSMQTSVHPYFANQPAKSRRPLLKDENRARLYSVRPLVSVIPMQP